MTKAGNDPIVVSLFTGIGGLDIGLEQAGFKIASALEVDPLRAEVLRANRRRLSVICEDIMRIDADDILSAAGLSSREPTLVVGGPPCQPFSKARLWLKARRKDDRARLVLEFLRIVRGIRPTGFIMENVPGLAGKFGDSIFEIFLKKAGRYGYIVNYAVLDACNFGVPQKRKRLFVIGYAKNLKIIPRFPCPTHGPKGNRPFVTAGDSIQDLDDGRVRDDEAPKGKWGRLLKLIPPGRNYLWLTEKYSSSPLFKYRSRYWSFLLKLHPELPSWTIPASPGPCTGPFHWRNRRLRISEVKRLQTFPDNWKLVGTFSVMRSHLGDAVPPVLAKKIGREVYQQMFAQVA